MVVMTEGSEIALPRSGGLRNGCRQAAVQVPSAPMQIGAEQKPTERSKGVVPRRGGLCRECRKASIGMPATHLLGPSMR